MLTLGLVAMAAAAAAIGQRPSLGRPVLTWGLVGIFMPPAVAFVHSAGAFTEQRRWRAPQRVSGRLFRICEDDLNGAVRQRQFSIVLEAPRGIGLKEGQDIFVLHTCLLSAALRRGHDFVDQQSVGCCRSST